MTRYVAVLASWLSCFTSFLWAMQGGFFTRPPGPSEPGTRKVKITGTIAGLTQLAVIARPRAIGRSNCAVGIGLYGASLVLFWRCIHANRTRPLSLAFSKDQPDHLVTRGPYRYIRHPFYTAYLLAWAAGPISTKQRWLAMHAIVMGIVYYNAARFEEAKFLTSTMAAEYSAYRRHTGMFLPRPARCSRRSPTTSARGHHSQTPRL